MNPLRSAPHKLMDDDQTTFLLDDLFSRLTTFTIRGSNRKWRLVTCLTSEFVWHGQRILNYRGNKWLAETDDEPRTVQLMCFEGIGINDITVIEP